MKRIAELMTPQPWTVQLDDSLTVARRMMAEREVHHLPVLDGGVVVGMVTDRDLAGTESRLGTVGDVMMRTHQVTSDAPLDEVLDAMTTDRFDAVIVTSARGVEGIFTATDAVRVLRDVVRRRRASA